MVRNAIILAAGKSSSFAPFTYERPKGTFCVKGKILIERQIEQLQEAGIKDIYVVIGYMKEKYFYLEQKYGVKLIVNNTFSKYGNIYSLYVARQYIKNSYICCADQYFVKNPFMEDNSANNSYRACSYFDGKFREFAVDYSDAGVISNIAVGGKDKMAMVGHAYFNESFSKRFVSLLEEEIDDFGIANLFWEEFYKLHQRNLTLYMKVYEQGSILEFDKIEDLRQFDSEFLINVNSGIISNICTILHCEPNDVQDINVIQAGLTNVSFSFSVKSKKYVYRHPGGTAGNLINRQAELFAQEQCRIHHVDDSLIYMDSSGWKISEYIENVGTDFIKNQNQMKNGMEYLRMIHSVDVSDADIKVFDDVEEGKKLMTIASGMKGNLFQEFADIIEKAEIIKKYAVAEANQMGIKKVLCHNDTYEPNYLMDQNGKLYLIDWEYAGLNDPANDIACILCRADYTDEQTEQYLEAYYGRKLTEDEHRHCIAYIALCAFYWFCWGLYKGAVGDDDGFFFLPAYRSCIRYMDKVIESYQK